MALTWATVASELLQELPAAEAAVLEARIEAAARAAEDLPANATITEIFERADALLAQRL
ncbi:hypothetical protein LRS10_21595 [Phenylobacterium sp. J426]|uniref:hypothetical protein n=1 Tax=Phenylobacterium sp. J426 TaxID=2898439 RepID=UPI0021518F87|nr:hypothetical protein [Phenylobacterium sp. J426]MCR5876508.1 hypothetical protein [Phenylobacterium sp. J426]